MTAALSPSALIGRDKEAAVLRRAVDGVSSGTGGVVLVTGEAGIGKSRLLREAARYAGEAGLTVMSGRAVPQGGAYRPLVDALLGQLRDATVTESPELRPFRSALSRLIPGWSGSEPVAEPAVDSVVVLGEGLLRLLRSVGGDTGCVVVLDDLHWADADSFALLEFLAGAVGTSQIVVLGAARTDEQWARDRLVANEDVHTVALDRFDREDIVALLTSRWQQEAQLSPEFEELIVARSEGVPLVVEELLAGLVESEASTSGVQRLAVPAGLTALVARRLAALTEDQRKIVHAAAVLGREVDWALLPLVSTLDEDAVLAGLRAAADSHLLVPAGSPGRLSWRHGLIRDAVLTMLGPGEHSVLARRAAEAHLNGTGAAQDDIAAAVELFVVAGDGPRAAQLLTDLARQAIAVGALGTADEQLEYAVQLAPSGSDLAAERVRVQTLSGRMDAAFATGDAALGKMSGDRHAELCFQLAQAALAAGRWDRASGYLERAGRPADARTAAIAADVAFGNGQVSAAEDLAHRAVEQAERDGMPEQCCAALEVLGRCARETDPEAAAAAFRRAAQVAADHGLTPARISALLALGTIELLDSESSATLTEARRLALDCGMLGRVCDIDQLLTDCALVVDGPAAGESTGRRTAELAAGIRLYRVQAMAEMMAAAGAGVRGDLAAMAAALDAAARRPDAPFEVTAGRPCIEAMVPLVGHDLPRAGELLDLGIGALAARGSSAPIGHWGLWALVRTVLDDRGAEARETLRYAPPVMRAINRAALDFADAIAAGRAGRSVEAVALLAAGTELLPSQHWWRRLLLLLTAEAMIADGWGEPVALLRAELTAFEARGDEQLARTCRTLLRRAGVTVRRGRGSAAVPPALRAIGVTSREMDVLGLVADRLTNQQVAERLFLSPRTVETHVTNLLAKTGTTSRAELVAYAARADRDALSP